jgi:ribosomal protein S18 acetylase RimI-like enzyme
MSGQFWYHLVPMAKSRNVKLTRDIREYLATPGSDPLAATILPPSDPNTAIGPEQCVSRGDIKRCRSPHGSTRYLKYDDGNIVAGLQVVSRDSKEALIANVYTRPEYRRRGLASALIDAARRDFRVVRWPGEEHISVHGRRLRDKTKQDQTTHWTNKRARSGRR